MLIKLSRYKSTKDATLGVLFINDQQECFTLEDEHREQKVYGETRIPSGRYEIKLRKAGRLHEKYSKRFPEIHRGMLELQNVPNFTTIYIHIGNTDDDTLGCILVGKQVDEKEMKLIGSTQAYIHLYIKVVEALKHEGVEILIEDKDLQTNRGVE